MNKKKSKSKSKSKSKTKKYLKGGFKTSPNLSNFNFILKNAPFNNNHTKIYSNNTSYNENLFVRESHNCYTYFLNLKNKDAVELCKGNYNKHNMCRRAQPGYLSGYDNMTKKDYNCKTIQERTEKDNPKIKKISENGKCSTDYYKGALVVAPERDYHYYRLNDDGIWSHKPGYKPSTIFDSKNNLITNPRKAARDYGGTLNYKDFCSYYCVPRNDTKKNMTHRNYSFNKNNNNNKNVIKHLSNEKKTLKKHYKKNNNTILKLGKQIKNILTKKNK